MANKAKKVFVVGALLTGLIMSVSACNLNNLPSSSNPAASQSASSESSDSSAELTVESISAVSNKDSFEWGEDLDITVTITYSDGSTEVITDYTVAGYNAENPGEQNVTISYEGKTCDLTVTVNNPVITSITATSNKENYEYGDSLDITVIATYSDGSTEVITDYTVEGYNSENPGLQDLVISYSGKTCDLTVTVNERQNRFPADKLNEFLESEGIKSTIPSPIGFDIWDDTTDTYQDGSSYFVTTTEDKGTVGVDSISDQYALLLNNDNWDVTSKNNSYIASKSNGDALLRFGTIDQLFTLNVESYVEFPDKALAGNLVEVKNNLKIGDKIVLGNISNNFIASDLNNENGTLQTVSCSYVNSKPTKIEKNIVRFTLEKQNNYWTLKDGKGRKLGATALGSLAWDEGSVEWNILFSNSSAVIINAKTDYGRLFFDQATGEITTYKTSIGTTLLYPQIFRLVETDLVYPTAISLSGKTAISKDRASQLSLDYVPANSNSFNDVTWSSSDESIATVNSEGVVTGVSAGNVTITAKTKSKNNELVSNFDIEIREVMLDSWTIMVYCCGADLESGSGYATSDITEMLSVNGQPDDVNIILETGGASSWKKYGISANVLSRYHIENKGLVLDTTLPKASMGQQSTLESFLNWGLQEYPAENTGIVFWNHGGALDGVCFDENFGDDSLLNSEVSAALSNVYAANGIDKLEFVGYDACLMQIQDVAEFNSHYFNYMVGSEEAEDAEGWAYNTWIDDVYAGKNTRDILKACCDGFIAACGSTSDQTLSYLDLSKMANYLEKFEALAAAIKTTAKNNYSSFKNTLTSVKDYGGSWWSSGIYSFGTIDGYDFLNKLKSNSKFNSYSTQIEEVKQAYNELVAYSKIGSGAGQSNGLVVIAAISISYPASETHFTNWRSIFN